MWDRCNLFHCHRNRRSNSILGTTRCLFTQLIWIQVFQGGVFYFEITISEINVPYFFISLVKSFGVHITVWEGEGCWEAGAGGGYFLWHINYVIFRLIMLATFWSISLNLWWCYSKHFDYLNVLRCQKTKQGRKILLIKICCCQGNCNLKRGFRNTRDPNPVCISQ